MLVQQAYYLEMLPHSGPAAFSYYQLTSMPFFSLQPQLRVSLQGCIVYLLLTHSTHIHKACCSAPYYLIIQNLFTLLLECE